MNYLKIFLLFLLCSFLQVDLRGQSDQDLVEVADEMYKFGDVKDAREVYIQATTINPSNAYANYMAGRCYLETIDKDKSLSYLLKAYEVDKDIVFNILYLIGTSYHLAYNFEKAIEYYELYRKKIMNERDTDNFKSKDESRKIDKRITECRYGIELLKQPVDVRIENMGKELNSPFEDYAPVISADQSVMYFTSRREGSTGGNKANDNEFFEDIYVARRIGDKWEQAQNIGTSINTNLHESSIGLSPDGKQLFIYIDDDKHTGDIFICKIDDKGNWSKPKPLSKSINSPYIENSATITHDGKTLYFSSNRPNGKGGIDIYRSHLQKNGQWGEPENLGDVINTEYDEEGPFIDSDGKTLYFSSRGHKCMGGYDLFKSQYDSTKGQWSAPVNLGYPINSTDDDIYFVVSGDGKFGYYASVKEDGLGDVDLYRILLNEKAVKDFKEVKETPKQEVALKKPAETKALKPVTLYLNILSSDKQTPLEAVVQVYDSKGKGSYYKGLSHKGMVICSISNVVGGHYSVLVEKEGYVYKKDEVYVPGVTDKEQQVSHTIEMDKISLGYRAILKNIYYDFDKATLRPASFPELDKLYKFLKQNPKVKIQIEGHTDSKGPDQYNLELSQKRSQSVVNYLVKKGIKSDRIIAKGMGETKPLASNDDEEEGRELNRRTEFVILAK